jgi:hypothetical protein
MGERGTTTRQLVFATSLPGSPEEVVIKEYDASGLSSIHTDAPDNGYSLIIIPFGSQVHRRFAQDAPEYPEAFLKPLVGWISGIHLDDWGKAAPLAYSGLTGKSYTNSAVSMHVRLPKTQLAQVGTINLFEPGEGDDISFDEEGFNIGECLVNGSTRNFADYLEQMGVDTRWPLVANYAGTRINVSFQRLDTTAKRVHLYAPVFRHVTYRLAAPLNRPYVDAYRDAVKDAHYSFACSCILNYLHGSLEGSQVEGAHGPATFGEIAHQLLNQTTVYLEITEQ